MATTFQEGTSPISGTSTVGCPGMARSCGLRREGTRTPSLPRSARMRAPRSGAGPGTIAAAVAAAGAGAETGAAAASGGGGIWAVSTPSGTVTVSPPTGITAVMIAVSVPPAAPRGLTPQVKVAGRPASAREVWAPSGTMP